MEHLEDIEQVVTEPKLSVPLPKGSLLKESLVKRESCCRKKILSYNEFVDFYKISDDAVYVWYVETRQYWDKYVLSETPKIYDYKKLLLQYIQVHEADEGMNYIDLYFYDDDVIKHIDILYNARDKDAELL